LVKVVGDLWATIARRLIVIGESLGLYKAIGDPEETDQACELAKRTGTNETLRREWLNANAASGYSEYDARRMVLHDGEQSFRHDK
jgi:hypothetical protein